MAKPKCPYCGKKTAKNGMNEKGQQRYKCVRCSQEVPIASVTMAGAKILVFDIENAPTVSYVWNKRMWNTSVNQDQLEEDWYMISWSAKWLNDSNIMHNVVTPDEAKNRDDRRVVGGLWELFNEADIIIAHNGKDFDIPMANTRFLKHGLRPPTPYRQIDTLRVARKQFAITFNHLDYLGKFLGIGHKNHTEFQLWKDCMYGDKKALQEMLDYNDQDVILLEDVYLALRPWTKSHINLNMYGGQGCSACGSSNVIYVGDYVTNTGRYDSYQCLQCNSYSRSNKKQGTRSRTPAILVSNAS